MSFSLRACQQRGAGKLAFRRAYEFCLAETISVGMTLRLSHSHPEGKDLFLPGGSVTPAFAKEYYEVRQELPRSFLH